MTSIIFSVSYFYEWEYNHNKIFWNTRKNICSEKYSTYINKKILNVIST